MLKYMKLTQVGLAPELRIDWAKRINLIAGDNGLGKSFLLDIAWWALTRNWAGNVALPDLKFKKPTIEFSIKGAQKAPTITSNFRRSDQTWHLPQSRPTMPGIVIYIRIDGGFSVWDPVRNYWRTDPGRPPAYHFDSKNVWDGLDIEGKRVCEGLERDWVNWQEGRKSQFAALEAVLKVLSPPNEPLRVGPPQRLFLGEGRDRPTLLLGAQTIPVALASAGVRRILALVYFLVWAWHEHRVAAELLGKKPENRVVLLFDEPETHLHPRWQRTVIPSLIKALDELMGKSGKSQSPQMLIATHSPLITASVEPIFDFDLDDLIHLTVKDGSISIEQGGWTTQGDASNWLTSPTFGLEQARSMEAERAIDAANAFMLGEVDLPDGLRTKTEIDKALKKLLPASDPFWPRWIVQAKLTNHGTGGKE